MQIASIPLYILPSSRWFTISERLPRSSRMALEGRFLECWRTYPRYGLWISCYSYFRDKWYISTSFRHLLTLSHSKENSFQISYYLIFDIFTFKPAGYQYFLNSQKYNSVKSARLGACCKLCGLNYYSLRMAWEQVFHRIITSTPEETSLFCKSAVASLWDWPGTCPN